MTHLAKTLLRRADSHDRDLLLRFALGPRSRIAARRFWTVVTHVGGAPVAIALALAPFFFSGFDAVGPDALIILVASHAMVQMVKRTVSRPRPSVNIDGICLALAPDRFSFPSGHSAAAMSIAIGYAIAFPSLAPPFLAFGIIVGVSRVMIGVHYPGDVVFGQLLSILTAALVIYFK